MFIFRSGFLNTINRFNPGAALVTFASLLVSYVVILFVLQPSDYQQEYAALIMFIHVPASWGALGVYCAMALCAAAGLVVKTPVSYFLIRGLLPIGCVYAFISLVTGSLWGKPMWGTYWVFDARLTSMLLLALIYLGLISVVRRALHAPLSQKRCYYLVLIGAINIPIIKFSVDWWTTLHQPASILRAEGPAMDAVFFIPLLLVALQFAVLTLLLMAMRVAVLRALRRQEQTQFQQQRAVIYGTPRSPKIGQGA